LPAVAAEGSEGGPTARPATNGKIERFSGPACARRARIVESEVAVGKTGRTSGRKFELFYN